MLTPGIGRMVLSTGFLTVTDTPQVLDTVKNFMEERNREMRRQVVLNIEILSIKKPAKSRPESTGTPFSVTDISV